jgi:hypothetical protein
MHIISRIDVEQTDSNSFMNNCDNCITLNDRLITLAQLKSTNTIVVVIFIIGGIVKSGECCFFIQKDDINACTFKGHVLEFKLFENDKYIWSGDYVSDLNKVNGNLCIEFETQVAVEDNEIINYIRKSNVDQAIEVLETFYNNYTTTQPNILNKITSPYNSAFVDNFKINTVSLNNDKPECKICKIKVMKMYMRSHVAKHILLGHTTGQVCGFCGILHQGNVSKEKTKNHNYKAAVY